MPKGIKVTLDQGSGLVVVTADNPPDTYLACQALFEAGCDFSLDRRRAVNGTGAEVIVTNCHYTTTDSQVAFISGLMIGAAVKVP